jgi:hypothetical protein
VAEAADAVTFRTPIKKLRFQSTGLTAPANTPITPDERAIREHIADG